MWSIEDNRQRSIQIWSDAQRKALSEQYKNTPLVQTRGDGTIVTAGGGHTVVTDNTVNSFVEDDYVEDYFE